MEFQLCEHPILDKVIRIIEACFSIKLRENEEVFLFQKRACASPTMLTPTVTTLNFECASDLLPSAVIIHRGDLVPPERPVCLKSSIGDVKSSRPKIFFEFKLARVFLRVSVDVKTK